jgi:CxxC motif-containing protein
MKRNLTCIICPRGCSLEVTVENGKATVTGNACPKGEEYGINECLCPVRTVTSILRVANRCDTMVSVKTDKPVKKDDIFRVMEVLKKTEVNAPIQAGDVLLADVFGADIIATKRVK